MLTVNDHRLCADGHPVIYPITIYYCKAGLKTGLTVRVEHGGRRYACRGVRLDGAGGAMEHGNATGKARGSGARCVLLITTGAVWMHDHQLLETTKPKP